jgi:hypothetical protein
MLKRDGRRRRVRRLLRRFICCVCIFWSATAICTLASEKPDAAKTSHFSVGIGWESLKYSEHDSDTHLDSEAKVSNWTIGLDGFKQWTHIFCGFKSIIPVHRMDDSEEWRVSDILTQQNSLEYGWTRLDAFLGYRIKPSFNPYIGLRWSNSEQERTKFVFFGIPVAGSATEEVTSWFISFGVKGDILLSPRLTLSYFGSYFESISSEVTNSNLPGWEVTDIKGYTFEFEAQAKYSYTESISFVFTLYGGKMHWNGSDWKLYASRSIKWPENETRYLGSMLNVRWSF